MQAGPFIKLLRTLGAALLDACRDLAPIVAVIAVFQILVLRQPLPELIVVLSGLVLVIVGLALFPVGQAMALQLSAGVQAGSNWTAYGWIYLFAFMVGFATTIAEPSLMAVAHKAEEAS